MMPLFILDGSLKFIHKYYDDTNHFFALKIEIVNKHHYNFLNRLTAY